jgi:hypothetical protein
LPHRLCLGNRDSSIEHGEHFGVCACLVYVFDENVIVWISLAADRERQISTGTHDLGVVALVAIEVKTDSAENGFLAIPLRVVLHPVVLIREEHAGVAEQSEGGIGHPADGTPRSPGFQSYSIRPRTVCHPAVTGPARPDRGEVTEPLP